MDANIVGTVQAFIAAHPLASVAFAALGGAALWHQALTWVETTGVDKAVAWFKTRQVKAAKRLGFSDSQIAEMAAEEAKLAQRAAADLVAPEAAQDAPQQAAAPAQAAQPPAAAPAAPQAQPPAPGAPRP